MTDQKLAHIIWDYMKYEGPLQKSDVIIGLGSSDMRTAEECSRLYNAGYASKILFTGSRGRISRDLLDTTEAEAYSKVAARAGVPESAVLLENTATNTGENILYSYRLLKGLGVEAQKIILVTKPYMLRRAYATFMKQWPGVAPSVVCRGLRVGLMEYCEDERYPFEYVVNVMVGDLQRIKEYPSLGFQVEMDIPDTVWSAFEELVDRGYTKHLIKDKK